MNIETTLEVLHEETPVEGNFMCTDEPEQDKRDEQEILSRLARGDALAWCCIKVTATYAGFTNDEYLGCCCFHEGATEDEIHEFAKDYGMFEEAKAGLIENLHIVRDKVTKAIEAWEAQLKIA